MNYNSLSRLYPNLNISKVIQENQIPTLQFRTEDTNKVQHPPKPAAQVIQAPKQAAKVAVPAPKPAVPIPKPEAKEAAPPPTPPPTPVATPPVAEVKAAAKPQPKKGPTMPAKGQRGIQKSLTEEEQKKQYLDKLSKMSVKRADTQLSKIEKVLEENKHDKSIMKSKELVLKKQLKLINEAMLFGKDDVNTEPINEVKEEAKEEVEVEEEENI